MIRTASASMLSATGVVMLGTARRKRSERVLAGTQAAQASSTSASGQVMSSRWPET